MGVKSARERAFDKARIRFLKGDWKETESRPQKSALTSDDLYKVGDVLQLKVLTEGRTGGDGPDSYLQFYCRR